MEILGILIPAALGLGLIGLIAFLWALKSGQFEDMDGAALRILIDDEDHMHLDDFRRAARHLVMVGNERRWDESLMHAFQKVHVHRLVGCGLRCEFSGLSHGATSPRAVRARRGDHGSAEHRRRSNSRGCGKQLSSR